MAYPSEGYYTGRTRFVYFNLSTTSSQSNDGPGSGGDNNVFVIYNKTADTMLTGSGVRLGMFQFTGSGDFVRYPAVLDVNFYPRVTAGDSSGGTTGSVWMPIFGEAENSLPSNGDWLVITTGSGTSKTNVKEIQFYWTGSSTTWDSDDIGGVADLKTLMAQKTNIPINAGCWSYSSAAQAVRDAVTGSGAIILRYNNFTLDVGDGEWTFPKYNGPDAISGGSYNIPGGSTLGKSGIYQCYVATVFPAGGTI